MDLDNFNRLKRYYNSLQKNKDSNELFLNSDRVHNALVMSVILDDSADVKMYCGELSLFRKSFKDKVEDDFDEKQLEEFSPIEILYNSLIKFLDSNKKIHVIMESNVDSLRDEPFFCKNITKYLSKNIFIYQIHEDLKADYHFTVGDSVRYRRETGALEHSAICSRNEPVGSQIMLNQFDCLLKQSLPIKNLLA